MIWDVCIPQPLQVRPLVQAGLIEQIGRFNQLEASGLLTANPYILPVGSCQFVRCKFVGGVFKGLGSGYMRKPPSQVLGFGPEDAGHRRTRVLSRLNNPVLEDVGAVDGVEAAAVCNGVGSVLLLKSGIS